MVVHVVEVAKAIAAADRGVSGRGGDVWATLSVDDQVRYTVMAQEAVAAYLAAVANSRLES